MYSKTINYRVWRKVLRSESVQRLITFQKGKIRRILVLPHQKNGPQNRKFHKFLKLCKSISQMLLTEFKYDILSNIH